MNRGHRIVASEPTAPQLRFFTAGLELLAEQGYGALKLAALCQRVGVTTGSFYHAFSNWQAYTDGLLAYWQRERTDLMAELTRTEPDPARRVEQLVNAALDLPHGAEAAIRSWAGIDPAVAAVQELVDTVRLETVHSAIAALMPADDASQQAAEHLAHTAFFLLIGYEQSHHPGGRPALEWALRMVQQQITTHRAPDA